MINDIKRGRKAGWAPYRFLRAGSEKLGGTCSWEESGKLWEASGRFWEESGIGRNLGGSGIWEESGRSLGGVWEAL